MNKTIYYSVILIINLLNYIIISEYTTYFIINIILIIFTLLKYDNVNHKYISVINPHYNYLLNNIYLYFYSMEDSKNTIQTESSNNSANNNLSHMEEEDNIGKESNNNSTQNNLSSMEDEREKVNYHILVAFSSLKKIYTLSHQSFYNIIGSALFTTTDIDLVFENIKNNPIISNRLHLLNGKSITLCVICSDFKSKSMELVKIVDDINITFNVVKVSEDYFFDVQNIKEFIKQDFSDKNVFFFFKETSWIQLVARLRICRIILSGGNKNQRHVLSTVQIKLSQFLTILYGLSIIQIVRSNEIFKKSWDTTPCLDYTSKKIEKYYKKEIYKRFDPSNKRNFHTSINPNKSDIVNNINYIQRIKFDKKEYSTSHLKMREVSSNNTINQYINYIEEIINNSYLNPKEAQLKIENIWIDLIENKLQDEKMLVETHGSKLHYLLFDAHKTLEILNQNKVINRKFPYISTISELHKIEYILLTFVWCSSYTNRLSYTSICRLIGENILYNSFKKSKFTNYPEFKNDVKYSNDLTIKLGDFFISLLTQFPHDIFERKFNPSSFFTRESVTLNINPNYLDEIRNNIIVNPYTLPMLCQPNPWNDKSYGGYLENKSLELSIITGSSSQDHNIENKNLLFKAVNYLNSIKFGVNNLLLDYLTNEGKYLLELIKPDNVIHREITLKIAKLFSKVPFYLNVHADWRGRLYTQSFFISYQGGDLSSSLLNFWDGYSLTESGKYHLYIHGANNHNENNISKESFDNRVEWVKKNYDRIINLDSSLILSAEKPFVFMAFCLNMKELARNPNAILKTPVFLDATCSGIQHLSALLLDLELGISVNLSPYNQKDKPNDIYSELLIHINKAINKYGEDNIKYEKFSLIKLSRNDVKTSVMTKVYNVSQYGIAKQLENKFKSSDYSNLDNNSHSPTGEKVSNLESELIKSIKKNKLNRNNNDDTYFRAPGIDNKPVILSRLEIFKIANIINDQIFVVFPSLNNIYLYFIETAKLMIKIGIPITWITPAGIKITQHYLKSRQSVISTKLFNKTKKMVIKEYLNETDKLKQSNAIIPNIIHSLDASHLMNVINTNFDQNFDPIVTVHDCFGTHPNNMEHLVYRVKKEFIILYSQQNFLETFQNRILQSIRDNNFEIIFNNEDNKSYVIFNEESIKIPNIPKLGDLDLKKIIESRYMIS